MVYYINTTNLKNKGKIHWFIKFFLMFCVILYLKFLVTY